MVTTFDNAHNHDAIPSLSLVDDSVSADDGADTQHQNSELSLLGQLPGTMPQWMAAAVINPNREALVVPAPAVPLEVAPAVPQQDGDGNRLKPLLRADLNNGNAAPEGQLEPRIRPLRAGVDFEPAAPLAENLTGTAYLEQRINNLPLQVRERIQGAIAGLQNPATRERSQDILREFGPAAVPQLIRQLDSDVWRQRDAATHMLRLMGDAAVPGLYSFSDNRDISLEASRRSQQLLAQLAPQVRDGAYDDQGRLRLHADKYGRTLFSAAYDTAGQLTDVRWHHNGASESFGRNADGTYTRDGQDLPVSNVRVSRDGNLSFSIANRNLQWNADGQVTVMTDRNEPLVTTTAGAGREVTVHGTAGGNAVSFNATPRVILEDWGKKRR